MVLNQQNCTIDLLTRGGNTFINLFVDNIPIIQGRKLSITKIIPYEYLKTKFFGNLIILNNDGNYDEVPNYKKFGLTQTLLYYTPADIP